MKYAQGQNLWIGAGLNGIHCAISACDALKIVAQVERLYSWVKGFLPDQK